jgi:hypothetical protein
LQRVLDVAAKALPAEDGGDAVRRGLEDGAVVDIGGALGLGLAQALADPSADPDQVDAAMTGALTLAVTRMLEQSALAGVAQAQLELGSVDVDWTLVNRDALAWARGYAGELVAGLVDGGKLIVPMRSFEHYRERIYSVQMIDADGSKKFLPGGRAKGAVYRIGTGFDVWLVEGYATALSVHAALESLYRKAEVWVCFSAGNHTM